MIQRSRAREVPERCAKEQRTMVLCGRVVLMLIEARAVDSDKNSENNEDNKQQQQQQQQRQQQQQSRVRRSITARRHQQMNAT